MEQISFGTAKCGHSGQIFKSGRCAHCHIASLEAVLDEVEEYLEQRADADGVPSGGGYRPNEEMTLLVRVQEARR